MVLGCSVRSYAIQQGEHQLLEPRVQNRWIHRYSIRVIYKACDTEGDKLVLSCEIALTQVHFTTTHKNALDKNTNGGNVRKNARMLPRS